MKSKALFASLLTLVALAFALTTVSAGLPVNQVCIDGVNANDWLCITDVEVDGNSVAVDTIGEAVGFDVSSTVPVVVKFTALKDVTEARMRVYVDGFKEDIEDETSRFHVLEGNTYSKRFSLKLPSTMDLDELSSEELALLVRASARGEDSLELEIPLEVQKELFSLDILSIERNEVVTAGETLAVDVVVVNNGFDRLDNVYVQATIPGLGISRKIYVGDLESMQDEVDTDINDARERRIYLTIPRSAAPGNYDMEVEAYNYDESVKESARVIVRAVETQVVPPVTTKTVAPGQEVQFDVVLVNPSDMIVLYTITSEESPGFFVDTTEPVVSVGAGQSKTTQVKVRASENVDEGTYIVRLNTVSDSGEVRQIPLTVRVMENGDDDDDDTNGSPITGRPNTVVVLTVILVIIFVVLLIILIVLLTRRPTESEEFGETNYY